MDLIEETGVAVELDKRKRKFLILNVLKPAFIQIFSEIKSELLA
jgi:hypothetical protein